MYIQADSSIQNPGGKVDMGTGPALVYHPPGISSECKARENQLGVDQDLMCMRISGCGNNQLPHPKYHT